MSETLIDLAHTYMGEFEYGMYRKRVYGGPTRGAYSGCAKRSRTVAPLSAKVKALQKKVALLRPETKVLQTTVNVTNVTDTVGSITYLSGVAQALTDTGRIGDKIHVTNISGAISAYNNVAAANNYIYSVFIIKDSDSNGVVPVISGTAQAMFTSFNARLAFTQTGTTERFKILARHDFAANAAALGGPQSGTFQKFNIKLNHTLTYRDTSSAQTGAGKNALYMVIITDDTADVVDFVAPVAIEYVDV